MLTDDLLQTDYLSNKVIIDMINVDSTDPLIGEAFVDQTPNVDSSDAITVNDSQANTSHHLANEDDKTPNDDNDSNQFSIPQSRPKRNLLINSKRPKSEYGPSPVMSNSKRIVKQSLKAAVRKQVECDNCNKTFSKQSHLNRHLLTTSCANQNTPQFMCEICGKTYSRKDNLQEHLRLHAGEITRKKNFKCSFCDKSFHCSSLCEIHERVHTGEKPFACQHCNKRFQDKGSLTKHIRTHTGEKPYSCSECDLSFSLKCTLNRHMYTHYNKQKPHVCDYCQKEFIQKSGLKAHLFYHTGENAFNCEICGRKFNRKARLQMHIKYVHEKDRSFNCNSCNKNFVRKEDLQRHLLSHTDNETTSGQKFECKACSLSFSLKESLKVHDLTHNKFQAGRCKYCEKEFLSHDFLNKHISAQHKDNTPKPSTSKAIDLEIGLETDESTTNSTTSTHFGEISLMDEEFNETLKKLLKILVDDQTLRTINGWPSLGSKEILEFLIKKCGHNTINAIVNDQLDECDRLRANLNLFFTIIDDEAVKRLLNNHSIDEVLVYLIN